MVPRFSRKPVLGSAVRRLAWIAATLGLSAGALLASGVRTEAGVARSGTNAALAGTQRVVVDDLAVRVPAEWRRRATGERGVFMFDPRHQTSGMKDHAVSFSVFSSQLGSEWGLLDEASGAFHELRSNPTYSQVTVRNVHPPGVHAFEFSFRAKLEDGLFLGRKYLVVHRGRIYWVTYEWLPRQTAAHLAQTKASVRSLRYVRGPYDPDIRTVVVTKSSTGMLSFRILFRHPTKLTAAHKLEVFLDTDLNAKTGARGAEYVLDYSKSSADLANWHTKKFSRPKSLRFMSTPRSATFRVSTKALGNPSRFSFFVYVAKGSGLIDQVPLYGLREAEWPYPGEHKNATIRFTSP